MDAVTLQLFSGGQETCLASPGLLLRSLSVLTLVFTNRDAVRDRARPQDCVHLQELLFLGSILDLQVFLSLCPWFFLHGSSTKEGPFLCDQNFSVTTQRILGMISGSRSDIHLVIFMVGPRVRLVAPGPPATTTAACKPAGLKRSMGTRTRTGFLKFLTDRFTELSVGF